MRKVNSENSDGINSCNGNDNACDCNYCSSGGDNVREVEESRVELSDGGGGAEHDV